MTGPQRDHPSEFMKSSTIFQSFLGSESVGESRQKNRESIRAARSRVKRADVEKSAGSSGESGLERLRWTAVFQESNMAMRVGKSSLTRS